MGSKRKFVSGAFYKSKLLAMSEFFKEIAIKEVEIVKEENMKSGKPFL